MTEDTFYTFENYRLIARKKILWRDDEIVPLTRKTIETLIVLIENRGQIVEKEDLMERVWADSFVEENNLNQCISALRKAFSDDLRSPRFIETIPRQGYRFIAEVNEKTDDQFRSDKIQNQTQPQSLAVLPFKYFGSEMDEEYLGLGMADTLITRLSHIREINVRPTSSILPFNKTDQNPADAGRELQVEKILEGSIRRFGERIRVTVQLIEVSNGETFWADKFDETTHDIFAVEDSIAEKLTRALTLQLTTEEKTLLTKHYAGNITAYHSYLKGRYLSNLLTFETFQKANEAFEKAIYHDSNYALAYEGLSYNYIQSIDLYLPTSEALSKAKEYAEKALSLDVDLPQAHADLGAVHFWYDWDWEKAESEFLRALEINPKLASSLRLYAWFLIFMQRFDESFDLFEQVRKLDPFSFENMLYTIPSHYFARDYDQAVKDISRGIQSFPDFWLGHIMLGRCFEAKGEVEKAFAKYEKALSLDSVPEIYGDVGRSYALLGKKEKALETLRELEKIAEIKYVAPFNFAMIYLGLGDLDKTFEYLEACYEERSWYLTWLKIAPVFDPLREDERFISLMKRVGI